MTHAIRLQKSLPATATTIDFTSFLLLFNVLGFVSGLLTSFFNLAINLGLFLFGEIV